MSYIVTRCCLGFYEKAVAITGLPKLSNIVTEVDELKVSGFDGSKSAFKPLKRLVNLQKELNFLLQLCFNLALMV